MKSFQGLTYEIDDLDDAVEELKEQIDTSELLKNTAAIVFCGYEVDIEELVSKLNEAFDFPFIGCTGLGLLSSEGFSQSSISMTVMTADDCTFEIGITDEIKTNEQLSIVGDKYAQLSENAGNDCGMIFAYAPWQKNILASNIIHILDKVSGGVPIFGGIASDGWTFDECRIFNNEKVADSGVVLMLINGNIKPIFTIEHSTTELMNSHKLVTSSKDTEVMTLNNEPATSYLKESGIFNEKTDVLVDYLATPFISTMFKPEDDDEIDVLRALVTINHEKGSCNFLGSVEEGSELNMVLISKKDIEGSVKKAFDDIFETIEKSEDYKYSTIMCSSCGARYSLIVSDKNTEGKAYINRLPEGINVQGFYSYGEYCPAKGKKYGKLYNVLSNESLAIVAF